VNQPEALTFLIGQRIREQVLVQLFQSSSFVIISDHLPPIPTLDAAERGLKGVAGSRPVRFRPKIVVDSGVQLS